jgi:hypothetical protein
LIEDELAGVDMMSEALLDRWGKILGKAGKKEAFLNCYAPDDAKISRKMLMADPLGHRFEQIAELLFKQEDHRLYDQTEHKFWILHSLLSKKSATGPDTHTLTFELCPLQPCETRGPATPAEVGCGRCDVIATLEYRDGVLRYWWRCGRQECSAHGEPKRFRVKWPEQCSPEELVAFLVQRLANKISGVRK